MKGFKRIFICILLLLIIGSVIFVFANPTVRYLVDAVISFTASNTDLEEIDTDNGNFIEIQLKELRYGSGCEFNQSMLLVNREHPLPADFEAELTQYEDTDAYFNRCAMESFIEMRSHIQNRFGSRLFIMSSFRSSEKQAEIYAEDTDDVAAKPGESEHETGLGLDVYIKNYAGMAFIQSEIGKYVNENCHQFGFIIRYPIGKKNITGFSYEPWHIRYVGLPHSEIIAENSLTYEEYIEKLEIDRFYSYENYIISKQDGDTVIIPAEYKKLTVSPDNLGNYIITAEL